MRNSETKNKLKGFKLKNRSQFNPDIVSPSIMPVVDDGMRNLQKDIKLEEEK